jgi:hypothetical protein
MSLAQRKALYADPYSPAAQDAQNGDDNSSGGQFHNPTSY